MSENRMPDYLDHIQQAATDARSFVEGMAKDDFLTDKRTQQAVIMSLIVIGEATTKVMDRYAEFTQAHADVPWRSMRNRMAHGHFDINRDVVWETVQEWLPALLQQLPTVRQDADNEDCNDDGMEPYPDWRPAMAAHGLPTLAMDRKGLSGPALRTFFRIADLWALSDSDQMTLLGVTARSTFFKWKKDPNTALPKDALERIAYILGVYRALQILLPDEAATDAWVKRPNQAPRSQASRRSIGCCPARWPTFSSSINTSTPSAVVVGHDVAGRFYRVDDVLEDHAQPVSLIQLFERVTEPDDLEALI